MSTTNNRIEWIDIAKGIGILLVIAGHTISLSLSYWIYSFHLPLFFVLSGLVFHQKKEKTERFYSFIIKKTKSLLIPFLKIWFFCFVLSCIIPEWRDELTVKNILVDFYTTNHNTINNSSIWYFCCLFVVYLYFYGLNYLRDKFPLKVFNTAFFFFSIFALYSAIIFSHLHLPTGRLPMKADSAMVAVVFFALAVWYKDTIIQYLSKPISSLLFCLLTFFFLAGAILNKWSNLNAMFWGRNIYCYIAAYPIAFLGIYLTMKISYYIQKHNSKIWLSLKHILSFYGKNSLVIFGFQSLFIRLIIWFFNHFELLENKAILYSDNPLYFQILSFVMVTFIFSPIFVIILKKTKIKL